jgi:hypothetical protein
MYNAIVNILIIDFANTIAENHWIAQERRSPTYSGFVNRSGHNWARDVAINLLFYQTFLGQR